MSRMRNIEGNPKDVEWIIDDKTKKVTLFFDKNHKGGVKDKALMLASYKKAIAANNSLSGQQKASLMNRNVTDL